MDKMIFVTFQQEGIHFYPNAPDDVDFLRHAHRHMFHFKVHITVAHNDRELEFIRFKRELAGFVASWGLLENHKSCEMMCDDLHDYIVESYPHREHWVEVSEDGENGALARYDRYGKD